MKKLKIVVWIFLTLCMMTGGIFGIYIAGVDPNEYVMPIISGGVLGIVVVLILSKLNKKRKGNIPNVDERTLLLLKRYFLIVLYVVLLGSSAILLILYSMGVHTIDTGMLILYMGVLYIVICIGGFVTTRL